MIDTEHKIFDHLPNPLRPLAWPSVLEGDSLCLQELFKTPVGVEAAPAALLVAAVRQRRLVVDTHTVDVYRSARFFYQQGE